MLETKQIGDWTGILIRLKNANLVMIVAEKGFVGCGYFNVEAADKKEDAMAIVTDVKTLDDVLNAQITKVSSKAREFGVTEGMTGKEALNLLS
ncbi:MAG: DUF1805 domain-containing protein [Candidatus Altiarchaeales archaeon]|nr:DUF1805 domain-containing protein [Candidatus Altiarchaeota archaeon]MCG2782004.1 DUF1805 domain-containing protein [Candidatus Altiarchaeales archaeon]